MHQLAAAAFCAALALCSLPAAAYRASDAVVPTVDAPAPTSPATDDVFTDPHAADEDTTPVPAAAGAPPSAIRYGDANLPAPVAATRTALIKAARSGDIEALRPVFARQRAAPLVAEDAGAMDPVAHLRLQSGDEDGQEILAILLEILEAGYVQDGEGAGASFIWPYFARVPLGALNAPQRVEVYRLLTSIDVEEMERLGQYTFFRVGIAADGRVRYFAAGDWD